MIKKDRDDYKLLMNFFDIPSSEPKDRDEEEIERLLNEFWESIEKKKDDPLETLVNIEDTKTFTSKTLDTKNEIKVKCDHKWKGTLLIFKTVYDCEKCGAKREDV